MDEARHEQDTESRTKMILEQIAANLPPLDEHTTRAWGSLLDEQAKGFHLALDCDDDDSVFLRHTCKWQTDWNMLQNLGLNTLLVLMFDHLLVCPDFNR